MMTETVLLELIKTVTTVATAIIAGVISEGEIKVKTETKKKP